MGFHIAVKLLILSMNVMKIASKQMARTILFEIKRNQVYFFFTKILILHICLKNLRTEEIVLNCFDSVMLLIYNL